jgi:CubicO group peptidase (beta-lactamase class C family)
MKARGIAYLAAGVFNSGVLAGPYDEAWYDYAPVARPVLDRARRSEQVCQRHGVALRTAALSFPLANPGVSVAVVQDGKFVWSGGFGMADLENSVPATADTLYRLGSISKPITATAALVLSERGQLDLDAPVQRYCPAFPQKPWPITTR